MAEKSMAIALLISFFLTGLGIAYVGDVKKGVALFAVSIILNLLSIYGFGLMFGVIIFIIWAYGMYATYREVNLYNGSY